MPITLDSFMRALGGNESGGDYNATNKDSGAHGKYQIMPDNWPSWSAEAGIPGAPQTPENQERVARYKIQQYYNTYGNWEDVAAVWYSGQPLGDNADAPQGNYPSIRSYVNKIVSDAGGSSMPTNAREATTTGITFKPDKPPEGVPEYVPTGVFQTDAGEYYSRAEAAYAALQQYRSQHKEVLVFDEDAGVVSVFKGMDVAGNPILEPDIQGTKLLQSAQYYSSSLDRLYSLKTAGLLDSGESAAAAFAASEAAKAVEADRKYQNFTTRVKDLVAIEDIPNQQKQSLAATLAAINEGNAKSREAAGVSGAFAQQQYFKPTPTTDVQPFADSLRRTIGEAPAGYDIDPTALAPAPTSAMTRIPVASPDEILQRYGITPPTTPLSLANSGPAPAGAFNIDDALKRWGTGGTSNSGSSGATLAPNKKGQSFTDILRGINMPSVGLDAPKLFQGVGNFLGR